MAPAGWSPSHAQRAAGRGAATTDGPVLDARERGHAEPAGATLVTREPARWGSTSRDHSEVVPHFANLPSRTSTLSAFSLDDAILAFAGRRMRQPYARARRDCAVWAIARRVRVLSGALTLVLIGLQLSIIAAAATFVDSGDSNAWLRSYPAFVLQTMGPALTSFRGIGPVCIFRPLIVMLLVQFAIISPPSRPRCRIEPRPTSCSRARCRDIGS